LYEGTTAIQGMDLFFRKIVRDRGQALTALAAEITATVEAEAGNGRLKEERLALKTALENVQGIVGAMVGQLLSAQEEVRNVYQVGLNTTRLLLALGDLLVGWLLVRQAEVATAKLDAGAAGRDRQFYEGKVAAARFFAATVLPRLATERLVAEGTTLELMDLDEAAF
jgi:hypothetical protein